MPNRTMTRAVMKLPTMQRAGHSRATRPKESAKESGRIRNRPMNAMGVADE